MPASVAIVGILNVTPDSFYDGGRYLRLEGALEQGLKLCAEGADWIDVGGESTRPGSIPVPLAVELDRVLPVIEQLGKRTEVPISVDTRRARVAEEALKHGASRVNAVTGLRDPELASLCARYGAGLVLNHIRGEPRSMQDAPSYGDVVREVREELLAQADQARAAGVPRERIWLDPGLGFGKDPLAHNLPLIARLGELAETGHPILVGPSRKRFLGELTGAPPEDRLAGTLAAVTACVLAGASAVRVHDVRAARDAVRVAESIRDARGGRG